MSKLKVLAASIGAIGAMGVAGPASAYVYGLSHLQIEDLVISVSGAALTTPPTFLFTLNNTATFVGAPVTTNASCIQGTCSAVSPVLDAGVANAGGNTILRGQNNFGTIGPGLGSYATADSVITTAQLVQGVPTDTNQVAESELNVNGIASANVNIQSQTNLSWVLTLGAPATLSLSFTADPDLLAEILDAAPTGSFQSQVGISAEFSLQKTDGTVDVTWSPEGTVGNNCNATGAACAETADSQDLNQTRGAFVNPQSNPYSNEAAIVLTPFGITITGLTAGQYTLTLTAVTSNQLARNVPEPGTMALLGAALAGLGFAGRRKSKRA